MKSLVLNVAVLLAALPTQAADLSLNPLPRFPRVERVDWDLAGRRLEGPQVLPGPFVTEPAAPMPLLPDLKK
jgi:hypothetical protein